MENKYIKQLYVGCNNRFCKNAFCKINESQEVILNAAEKLKKYDDLFICENSQKLLSYKKYNPISNMNDHKGYKIDFKNSNGQKCFVLDFLMEILDFVNCRKDLDDLDHNCCKSVQSIQCETDKFILCNVVIILLKKYEEDMNFILGLIAIRVLAGLEKYDFLSQENIISLCNLFINIYHHSTEELFRSEDIEGFDRECFKAKSFTLKDFVFFVNSVVGILENTKDPFIRTNNSIEDLLNVLTILYLSNEKFKIFPYKKFYLVNVCKKQNLKEEFRFFKSDCKSIFQYGFVLPLDVKAEFLRYENSDTMKASLQDAFFRALFEGAKEPYLFITVNRATIYHETFEFLANATSLDLKKQIKITFKNEEGIDSGGIRKEFFQLLAEELRDDMNLFTIKNNILWLRRNTGNQSELIALGKLLGIALYNDVILNLPFPNVFFKKLLGKEPEFEDLHEIEPEIYLSLCQLKRLSPDEINELELDFTISYNDEAVNLQEDFRKPVTGENIDLFIQLYSDYILNTSIDDAFTSLKVGFNSIIKKEAVLFLQPKELEKIVVGSTCLDVEQIKKCSKINGFKANSKTTEDFWTIFEEYDYSQKKALLQFITGNDRIPVSGAESLKLIIMKNGCNTERLPSAQTCFNTLLLPDYEDRDKLRDKLSKAISMTKGFYLL